MQIRSLALTVAVSLTVLPIYAEEGGHGYLGILGGDVIAADGSVAPMVVAVMPGSPAEQVGLQPGDRIVRMGKTPLTSYEELVRNVRTTRPGDQVTIAIERDANAEDRTVTLAEVPHGATGTTMGSPLQSDRWIEEMRRSFYPATPIANRPRIGVRLAELSEEDRASLGLVDSEAGVRVVEVVPGSPADMAGIRAEDVILTAGGVPLMRADTLVDQVTGMRDGDPLTLEVWRDGQRETVTVEVQTRSIVDPSLREYFPRPNPGETIEIVRAADLAAMKQRIADLEAEVARLRQQVVDPSPTP